MSHARPHTLAVMDTELKKKYIVTAFTSVMPAGGKTRFVLVIGDGGERAERWCK